MTEPNNSKWCRDEIRQQRSRIITLIACAIILIGSGAKLYLRHGPHPRLHAGLLIILVIVSLVAIGDTIHGFYQLRKLKAQLAQLEQWRSDEWRETQQ